MKNSDSELPSPDHEGDKIPYILNLLVLFTCLYLFVVSLELIKTVADTLAPDIQQYIFTNISPLKAIAAGWFTTAVAQSSGAVGTVAVAFTGQGLISLSTAIYILVGASLGTTVTALTISLITVAKERADFRHGFEIAMCYSLYSLLLVFIVVFLEYFFSVFSRLSLWTAGLLADTPIIDVPNIIEISTDPVIKLFEHINGFLVFLIALITIIFSLRLISSSILKVLGGEQQGQKFINRFFDSKFEAYLIGMLLTALVFSSSITISLLVPLAVARIINLRKAIPFILGADVGTATDVFLAALVVGNIEGFAAAISFIWFGLAGGLIFLPNTEFLYKLTKLCSVRMIQISRQKALIILAIFIITPVAIMFVL